MIKRFLHILIIVVLALNLMGAWAFASAFDCGMECCELGDWPGTVSYEAPSCCAMDEVTCGFETGQYEELFDTAICCFNSADSRQLTADGVSPTAAIIADTPTTPYSGTVLSIPPPPAPPLYLSNETFLC